jgi:hypothetical protein
MNSLPLERQNNPLNYIYFTQPHKTAFKTFFYSKTYLFCDLGSHIGKVISPYENDNKINQTNIMIIHYHHQCFESYITNCKTACISHDYINIDDTIESQINKLSILPDTISSFHKKREYLNYLYDSAYINKYYNSFINTPNKYVFDKLKNIFSKNDKCIIITTINEPTQQILSYTHMIGWDLIIIGDSKTNNNLYKKLNCIYLGLEEQQKLFPSIYDKIPLNSYARKMFGYLYAAKNKYSIIYDTDDDNKYIEKLNSFKNNFKYINNTDFLSNDVHNKKLKTFKSPFKSE